MACLSDKERITALSGLPDWHCADDSSSISITYRFDGFATAIGFMMQIAVIADKMNHHPDWSNGYNRVKISLSTHDAGGLTMLDIDLAKQMDRVAASLGATIL